MCILQDVFIFDTQKECFVWIGNDTDLAERKNGMTYAHVSISHCYHKTVKFIIRGRF